MRLEDLLPKYTDKDPRYFDDEKIVGVEYEDVDEEEIENTNVSMVELMEDMNAKVQALKESFPHVEDLEPFTIPDYLKNDPEVVGYPDLEMQNDIYTWVMRKIGINASIKDFGCGRGDFGNMLSHFEYESFEYFGFELKNSLCEVAKVKYPHLNVVNQNYLYIDTNENPEYQTDYTVCIGTLNEDNGTNKWNWFLSTLNCALNTTNKAIVFVLARDFDELEGFNDYPFDELFQHLPKDLRFEIDYNKFEDIYCLTVHIGGYN